MMRITAETPRCGVLSLTPIAPEREGKTAKFAARNLDLQSQGARSAVVFAGP